MISDEISKSKYVLFSPIDESNPIVKKSIFYVGKDRTFEKIPNKLVDKDKYNHLLTNILDVLDNSFDSITSDGSPYVKIFRNKNCETRTIPDNSELCLRSHLFSIITKKNIIDEDTTYTFAPIWSWSSFNGKKLIDYIRTLTNAITEIKKVIVNYGIFSEIIDFKDIYSVLFKDKIREEDKLIRSIENIREDLKFSINLFD